MASKEELLNDNQAFYDLLVSIRDQINEVLGDDSSDDNGEDEG